MVEIKKGKIEEENRKKNTCIAGSSVSLETLFFSLLTVRHKVRSYMSASVGSYGRL